ncbi:[weak similarity to] domain protein [methanotrophic bacterial endosymbiont of Bathymodiolus sp.]|nr:[weak similarity to] domain protein [methanotrophic bacterial endosymbiont of Bathymodiolus sp.]
MYIATPFFRYDFHSRQLLHYFVRVGFRFIDFVNCNNHRHTSSTRMLNRFFGLRHNAIIRCNNHNNYVGNIRTTCTHRCKSSMPRCIQKSHRAMISFYLIGANMLRNSTRFA